MEFHMLDLIMYIIIGIIIWICLPSDFKEELGILVGWAIMLIYTVVYLILFSAYPNWDWIDLFGFIKNIEINW